LLFSLVPDPPANASSYRFESVEVKETGFRLDGLFLPPERSGLLYIVEVQFQLDLLLYERLMCELHIYGYRQRHTFYDWRGVVIYPSRSVEQPQKEIVADAISTGRLQRIYLDELGEIETLPVSIGLMVLTTLEDDLAITAASRFIQENPENQAILDSVSTSMVYKFIHLSRDEVNAMIGIELSQTRVYQEAKAEGKAEEARALVLRLLHRKLGALKARELKQIDRLSLEQLESLGEALLDFGSLDDLQAWLVDSTP
jgi:predicted transposase/invertase (TIGR01784 family)